MDCVLGVSGVLCVRGGGDVCYIVSVCHSLQTGV